MISFLGGIVKYEEAFFSDDYLEDNPDHKDHIKLLQDLIADQIPILEVAMDIHRVKVPQTLKSFHQHLEECFIRMKSNVEAKYGRKYCDLKEDGDRDSLVVLRRGNFSLNHFGESNRLSETSMGSSE